MDESRWHHQEDESFTLLPMLYRSCKYSRIFPDQVGVRTGEDLFYLSPLNLIVKRARSSGVRIECEVKSGLPESF
jgi:hypothetical protein